MFGWMEPAVQSPGFEIVRAVVPTIALPLAAVGFAANVVATTIAGWFGLKLKWEGPKRLLEVLLKPKVLASAVVLNLGVWGLWTGYRYWHTLPAPLWRVERVNANLAKAATLSHPRVYDPVIERANRGGATDHGAHEPVTLRQEWHVKLPKSAFGGVVLSGSSAFVGSDDGYVHELERATGKEIRKFFVGSEVTPDPVIWKNLLIVGEGVHDTHHCRIYFFDLMTGLFKGAFATRGHTEGQPVIAESGGITQLFIMAGQDGVYAIDPETLKERWHVVSGHVDSEVRVADGLVYFATGIEKGFKDRTHHAIAADFLTGKIVWKRELPASGWMAPLVMDERVCFGSGEIYTDSKAGWLTCLNRKTGVPTQSATLDAPVMSIPYLSDSAILVADLVGNVCSLDASTLARRWCVPTASKKAYATVVADARGRLLYPTTESGLWVLDPASGAVLAKWKPQEAEGKWGKVYSRVSVASDGWFLADMDGNVRKLIGLEQEAR